MRKLALVALVLVSLVNSVAAEDMWNGEYPKNYFQPHRNNCNSSTEVFVPMGLNGTGGSYGFCIEKDERSAAYWDVARQTCAALGKRLPEPAEYIHACINAGGLNNTTDDFEWTANSPVFLVSANHNGLYAPVVGDGGCRISAPGALADYNLVGGQQLVFRCVY